jgi:phosphopantetheinyl transferase
MLFRATGGGKPLVCVPDSTIARAPGISLSHSGGMVAVAACARGRIGVDLETVRPIPWRVADRVFADADRQALRALPPPERERAFAQMWTVAEACAKGVGRGLQLLLAGFDQLGLERHGYWGAFHWGVDFLDPATACAVATDKMQTFELCVAELTEVEFDWLLHPL